MRSRPARGRRGRRRLRSSRWGAEVLAEGARLHQQGMFAQFGDPGGVVFARIMVDRLLDAAMDAQVALFVAFQADGGDPERTVARRLAMRCASRRAGRAGRGR